MSRSFRFVPPQPRDDAMVRPRLLRSLVGRWHHRVTSITGGAGLGKTTLLVQAIAENRLAPRGDDVWIGLEPHDADADQLARAVVAALSGGPGGGGASGEDIGPAHEAPVPEPAAVADAVWHRSPGEACVMFDDIHLLPSRSTGARWLSDLVQALPANGHVVMAGRLEPPVPLTRFDLQGALLRVVEDDLRFSDEELSGFAELRGVDRARFEAIGGWPAMAELVASVDAEVTGSYLWEEVLEPLGAARRLVLAVLCDLGGADDRLASAAVGVPVELDQALDGIPLVARSAAGWFKPHGLWSRAPGLGLGPVDRAEVRHRAADHLVERGRFDDAFTMLQEADLWDAPATATGTLSVHSALASASVQLAEGDEPGAVATLRDAMAVHGLDKGVERRWWRQLLALGYVLLPETREHWESLTLRDYLATSRDLARMVVALRDAGSGRSSLDQVELPSVGMIRASLPYRLASELAAGLAAAGRPEGGALLDALGPPGRTALRDVAASHRRQARAAKTLLAAVPALPPRIVQLGLLGSWSLRRDGSAGEEVADPEMRRQRLQELLAFLVSHRRTTRSAITATLWPDLDERAAANNLGVTLNHLLRLLEPWRGRGEPSYLVRLEGPTVRLVTGDYLQLDVDAFDQHLAAAARAEADGAPSLAMEHNLASADLYRGDLYADLPEAPWFALDREHYRSRYVAAAIRAGQLLLGRGEPDRAEALGHRALAVDQWSEAAYAVLVGAALARGDRSAARRILDLARAALADLGVEPSSATRQLERRVLGAAA